MFEVSSPEEDALIVKHANNNNIGMLAIIAPYAPLKVTPTRFLHAELGAPEEFGIENFIEKAEERNIKKIYILIHSFGGNVDSAYIIAKALRDSFKEMVAFIPQIAASGATLIAISCDKIIMGRISRLSPIDVQIYTEEGKKSALALLRGFQKLNKLFEKTGREDIPYTYQHLIESVDLTTYEEWNGILNEMREYAVGLLEKAKYERQKAEDIADNLVFGFSSHTEVIDYRRAERLGLKVEWYDKYREDWKIMRRWLAKYLFKPAGIHHIRYVLPEGGVKNDRRK